MMIVRYARRLAVVGVLLFVAIGPAGCDKVRADKDLIEVPNTGRTFDSAETRSRQELAALGVDYSTQIVVPGATEHGASAVTVSAWVLDPAPHASGLPAQPSATIFLIHDRFGDKSDMLEHARALADSGYRVILTDSRGHGHTHGQWATYGLAESIDMKNVLTHLAHQGQIVGEVGVYGRSYGGATALHWAAADKRIRAVICVSTFTSVRNTMEEQKYKLLQKLDQLLRKPSNDAVLHETGRHAGFDPYRADNVEQIQRVTVPVLLIHGAEDDRYPLEHGRALAESTDAPFKMITIPEADEDSIYEDHAEELRTVSGIWFTRWLTDQGMLVEN